MREGRLGKLENWLTAADVPLFDKSADLNFGGKSVADKRLGKYNTLLL